MSVVEQPQRARTVNETNMIHFGLTCCREPEFEALCGAPLVGDKVRGDPPLDCIVCDQMSRQPRTCPACGERMERR